MLVIAQVIQIVPEADRLWVITASALVFLMQAGFLALEAGLTRTKNAINVAIKNMADFGISTVLFWAVGFGIMFGPSFSGWLGSGEYFMSFSEGLAWPTVFFTFQVMFAGTAVTIVSGAVAERLKFGAYLLVAVLVAGFTYPIFGHWAWNGLQFGEANGWLGQLGFYDFAGSTVVHSMGGWTALALLLILGPRIGRFPKDGPPKKITGSNLPLAAMGALLLWIGWLGFNGGSTLSIGPSVGRVIAKYSSRRIRWTGRDDAWWVHPQGSSRDRPCDQRCARWPRRHHCGGERGRLGANSDHRCDWWHRRPWRQRVTRAFQDR